MDPWWIDAIKGFLIINIVLVCFAYTTWLERKVLSRMQGRFGPNRAGPFGLLQPIADLVKLVRKEAFAPMSASDHTASAYSFATKPSGLTPMCSMRRVKSMPSA